MHLHSSTSGWLGPRLGSALAGDAPGQKGRLDPKRFAELVLRLPLRAPGYARGYRNYLSDRLSPRDEGDWAIGRLRAHEFGLVVHFTSLAGIRQEVTGSGFELVRIFTNAGETVDVAGDETDAQFYEVVVRRV